MANVYGYKRFRYPTTHMIHLSAKPTVTEAVGATGNPDFNSVMGLGRKDVGCVIEVTGEGTTSATAEILAAKPTEMEAGHTYYLLAEVPVSADASDFNFVGAALETMADIENLIERNPANSWAKQFADLRNGGVK